MKRFRVNTVALISVVFIILLGVAIFVLWSLNEDKKPSSAIEENGNPVSEKKLQIVDLDSKSRPYAVMINNISIARTYQSGLQDAYIVYEMIVEGGITRMMALFKDVDTARIGSIRSSRHYFLDYALENDAIYVHHGQSPQALADFSTLGIDRIEVAPGSIGWRDKDILNKGVPSEHTLFTSIEMLEKGLGNKRTETNKDLLLNYSVDSVNYDEIDDVKDATSVKIAYTSSNVIGYTYDAENKVYLRDVNGKKHTDYVSKKQYTVKNIITYQVKNSTISGDNKGRQEFDNIGEGTGYLITEGKAIPIKWSKSSRSSQTKYTYLNGEEIVVNDGNTFIQIQPKGQKLTIK